MLTGSCTILRLSHLLLWSGNSIIFQKKLINTVFISFFTHTANNLQTINKKENGELNLLTYTDSIIETITKYLPKNEQEWELVGFINREKEIYAFGNDSKIIGRLFEVIAVDALLKAAKELGYTLFESTEQTVYPDFYFLKPNGKKVAVDIKTTYRKTPTAKYGFTGGSFTSYMRNGTKNIVGKYSDYDGHYILGVVYTREKEPSLGKTAIEDLDTIVPAYKDIEVFVQEKYRICGDKKGSGNTDNIGTIKANTIKPFIYGAGPFAFLGKDIFHDYWIHHPKYKDSEETKSSLFNNLSSYIAWVGKNDPTKAAIISQKYEKYKQFIYEKNADNWN